MPSIRRSLPLALISTLSACAVSGVMPPFSATRAYLTPTSLPAADRPALYAPRVFEHHKHIVRKYDQTTDQTRVSVTTHRGAYFLWIQRPRLTFLYVHTGPAVPEV